MNTTDIRRVVLTMDDTDVQRRTENLTRRLTNAKRVKDQLEKKAATGQLTRQETRDQAKFTKEVNLCERELVLHSAGFPLRFDGEAYRWAMVRA